jgi:hypothetical protein
MVTPEASITYLSPDLSKQEAYAKEMADAKFDFSAVVMGAVVKGMRDLGYKSMGTALDELIDNSIQAEAQHIHLYMGEEAKPDFIAVIDDGHGMSPTMLRLSAVWGAGHHQEETEGFGKYGYGLPSACVSMGKRFTVFSKLAGAPWHKVYLDLTEIETGTYRRGQRVQVRPPVREDLPKELLAYVKKHFKNGLESGTVVFVDKLDRLTWKTTKTIDRNLKQHFGLIYRNFLRNSSITVQGVPVKPVDPLFLTPDAQFYDLDEERAMPLPPIVIEVKHQETRAKEGELRLRYASMPAGFGRRPEDKLKPKSGKTNARFPIIDENNGIIVLRSGRQIDVVRSKRDKELGIAFAVNNDDRYWGVELDFDPSLDDEFSITTSKQQVYLSDRIWQLLKENNVFATITDLRRRYDDETAKIRALAEVAEPGNRRSEQSMAGSDKFLPKPAPNRVARGEGHLQHETNRRAAHSGVDPKQVRPQVQSEAEAPYKVLSEATAPSAAFYEPVQFGGQTRATLNERHPFYSRIYNGPFSTPEVRDALEILLLVLADGENNSEDERRLFYQAERSRWSQRLMLVAERYSELIGEPSTEQEPIVSEPLSNDESDDLPFEDPYMDLQEIERSLRPQDEDISEQEVTTDEAVAGLRQVIREDRGEG